MPSKKQVREEEAAQARVHALRRRYGSGWCVCGRPKKMRTPFCRADMAVLGEAQAPRPLLHGDLDDPATAAAWETCLTVLQRQGYVKEAVTLG